MDEYTQHEDLSVPSGNGQAADEQSASEQGLTRWLQSLLQESAASQKADSLNTGGHAQLDLLWNSNYHVRFYQQLPDLIMALLSNDARATIRYAPLLYHLAGCHECHVAYLDLYDSLYAAVHPRGVRPVLGQGTRTLDATPHRMLSHLCQTLISQAEAVIVQARREQTNEEEHARSLLQLALRISAHISQSTIRRQALHDLVRVAMLAQNPEQAVGEAEGYAYTPLLAGAGGVRSQKSVRRIAAPVRGEPPQEQAGIQLRAQDLDGVVMQRGTTLYLQLQDLGPELQGHHLTINVALGSLIEPVRWIGGNPHAIKSETPVDASGLIVTPLGETELQLKNPEDRNLLEALFLLLRVRPLDQAGG